MARRSYVNSGSSCLLSSPYTLDNILNSSSAAFASQYPAIGRYPAEKMGPAASRGAIVRHVLFQQGSQPSEEEMPGEIRNMIYSLVLQEGEPIQVVGRDQKTADSFEEIKRTQPPFTQICQQARAESLLVFYANNTFTINLHLNSPSDVEVNWQDFERQAQLGRGWIRNTPAKCHKVIPQITISLAGHLIRWEKDTDHMIDKTIKGLVERLVKAGYGQERLSLLILERSLSEKEMYMGTVRKNFVAMGFGTVEFGW